MIINNYAIHPCEDTDYVNFTIITNCDLGTKQGTKIFLSCVDLRKTPLPDLKHDVTVVVMYVVISDLFINHRLRGGFYTYLQTLVRSGGG